MRKKLIYTAVMLVILFSIERAVVIAASTSTPAAHPKVKVEVITSAFGSNAYVIAQAIESMSLKRHPWLQLSNAEGPGCGTTTYNILENIKGWKDRIGCSDTLAMFFASQGMPPFKKKYDDAKNKVKALFNFSFIVCGLITMDPKIKTEQDLAGKDIALGRIGQTGWALAQKIVMEKWATPPVQGFRLVYMDPKQATDAMVDGRVAACTMIQNMTPPDFRHGFFTGPMNDLISMGHKFHWIRYTDKTVAKGKKEMPGGWIDVPANSLGGNQPETISLVADPSFFAVDVNFPEELAYEVTKFVIENCGDLDKFHTLATPITKPGNLCWGLSDDELHPGALKAYKEAGLK
jgi:TRAP transporter TAXI family solute receptor